MPASAYGYSMCDWTHVAVKRTQNKELKAGNVGMCFNELLTLICEGSLPFQNKMTAGAS